MFDVMTLSCESLAIHTCTGKKILLAAFMRATLEQPPPKFKISQKGAHHIIFELSIPFLLASAGHHVNHCRSRVCLSPCGALRMRQKSLK